LKEYFLRVIFVEPVGSINLGFIARLIRNFDVDEFVLVNPRLNTNDWEKAKIYASRARDVIENVKIYDQFDDAIRNADLVVATSAIYRPRGPNILRRPINMEELLEIIRRSGVHKIYIVLGRESTGLTNEEISKCDLLLSLETSDKYPTLNVSNAAAIILYELFKGLKKGKIIKREKASRVLKNKLLNYYRSIIEETINDPAFCKRSLLAFKNIVNRGVPDRGETTILIRTLRKIYFRMKSC